MSQILGSYTSLSLPINRSPIQFQKEGQDSRLKKLHKKYITSLILAKSYTSSKQHIETPILKVSHQEPKPHTYLTFPLKSHYHPCTSSLPTQTTSPSHHYLLIIAATPQQQPFLHNIIFSSQQQHHNNTDFSSINIFLAQHDICILTHIYLYNLDPKR